MCIRDRDISILGNYFYDPIVELVAVNETGITLDNVIVVNATQITARITVAPTSTPQNTSIRVTTAGGFTTSPFQVRPLPPVLTSISPPAGNLGTTMDITLTGGNFFGVITVDAGSGIT